MKTNLGFTNIVTGSGSDRPNAQLFSKVGSLDREATKIHNTRVESLAGRYHSRF
jgi:hypothetical protein